MPSNTQIFLLLLFSWIIFLIVGWQLRDIFYECKQKNDIDGDANKHIDTKI